MTRQAQHDLVLAVHQNLTADGITIAFPQMVVWGGVDKDGAVYQQFSGPIRTELPKPGTQETTRNPGLIGPLWRRLRNDSATSDGGKAQ